MTALWILFSSFCSACILASIQCLKETLAFIDVAFVQFMFVLAVTVVVMIIRKVPCLAPASVAIRHRRGRCHNADHHSHEHAGSSRPDAVVHLSAFCGGLFCNRLFSQWRTH